MAETQKKRSPVMRAVLLLLAAAAVLGAAFYLLDGVSVVSDLLGWESGTNTSRSIAPPPRVDATRTPPASGLRLPKGVSETYALRLWQEQIDSQESIRKLIDGDIVEFTFGKSTYGNYAGKVLLTVKLDDGTSADGELRLAKRGAAWYVESIGRLGSSGVATSTVTPLPAIDDVHTDVLNTVFAEQGGSQEVFQDYLMGNVRRIVIREVKMGAGTATIIATMYEKDHTVDAEIVAISAEVDGEKMWFLSRFAKTAEIPNP